MSDHQNGKTVQTQRRSFLERVAERFGMNASAKAVFSEPIERDGVTVIPVAKVRWAFGGGSGRGRKLKKGDVSGQGSGGGGGGGMHVAPLGYIEIKDGETKYKPICDPTSLVPIVIASGITGWILLRAMRKLIRK
jgi:uncharacterized spore protein YtfJ